MLQLSPDVKSDTSKGQEVPHMSKARDGLENDNAAIETYITCILLRQLFDKISCHGNYKGIYGVSSSFPGTSRNIILPLFWIKIKFCRI